MTKRTLGYVELEWICPNCNTRNPGSRRTCMNCGLPQPDNVEFQQPAQEKLLEDEAKIAQAKSGPDIHCYYCGARNPATATRCSQCGADLSEGARRKAGEILGAHQNKPVKPVICPACGTPNAPDAANCSQCGASLTTAQPEPIPLNKPSQSAAPALSRSQSSSSMGRIGLVVLAVAVVACIIAFFVLSSRTEDITGTVEDVAWTRTVVIEGLVPVERETWRDNIPVEGVVLGCTQEIRGTQSEPAPNSREVCGTPYTVDTGSGFGQVVQDCQYQVYDDYCRYSINEWRAIDEAVLRGNNFSPQWPALSLRPDQRQGHRDETYRIVFSTSEGTYEYVVRDPAAFQRFQNGSQWILEVNTFNAVTDVKPAE
ncbi:MAG: zinc ribbon domain-containing protein [Anaerolineaceae bacterium]|nr:zinc ribbon domain-containing protein [Anaerolineaceae bacterium]MCB9101011.1 zinc ribbon domain-containing protein [Anaerolineales bacterium]